MSYLEQLIGKNRLTEIRQQILDPGHSVNRIELAQIKFNSTACGILIRKSLLNEVTYYFQYHSDYVQKSDTQAVSLSLPKRRNHYYSEYLFGYFDNLTSEGWLKDTQCRTLRINPNDHFSLLMHCGQDTAGAVSIHPLMTVDLYSG